MLVALFAVIAVVLLAAAVGWILAERGSLLRPSTRRFFKESGWGWNTLHGYIYGHWTRLYIRLLLNPPAPPKPGMVNWLANHYHGKVLTHEHAQAIISNDRNIPLQDLEQIIPYPVARNLVLNGPPDVAAFECVCRHARAQHCEPTQVCMVTGQPFVDFILEHQPKTSRLLTRDEALELLRAEHERGHLHSAWFKDAMLNRFYGICNCCKCCCGGIQAMTQWGARMMAPSGYVAVVNQEECAACGTCVETCAFNAMSLNETSSVLDWERCMGCGACEVKCPSQAITLVRDERKGIPLDVRCLA
jgi:Pyruvate/2-oxoacid:ferredoxin oxidoreductase delta subunit